ncbi:Arc family DNA-binding protein [Pararhizobium sp. O133]|uniref:Arc family DNA-binding protein n=1 Tax=Pararhizobium sp. O133 TaxID=3449278 RepID=UPI003F685A68
MTDNSKELLANIAPFGLRMQADLKERIKAHADKNNRSMNAEIVATLEREYPAPADVMHIHLGNIRRALDKYERETDPRARMHLQTMVEAMVTSGQNLEINWDEEGEAPQLGKKSEIVEVINTASDMSTVNSVADALKKGDVAAAVRALHVDVQGELGDALRSVFAEDATLELYADLLPKIVRAKKLAETGR